MNRAFFGIHGRLAGMVALALLAGCAARQSPSPAAGAGAAQAVQCQAAGAGEAAVGNWYAVRSQQGVAGQLAVLIRLQADGSMRYQEQLKRGGKPSQALNETGCWQRDGKGLLLQTVKSNGEPVELSDPIYKNHYTVRSQSPAALTLDGPGGQLKLRRMPDDYRLPF